MLNANKFDKLSQIRGKTATLSYDTSGPWLGVGGISGGWVVNTPQQKIVTMIWYNKILVDKQRKYY